MLPLQVKIRQAMKPGEVDSVVTGWESLRVTNMKEFETGEWQILSQWVEEPLTDLPQKNVPSIYQFARNDEEKQLFRLGLVKPNSYARPYALPPGVPADRVRALEMALQKTLRDPELLAEAEKSRQFFQRRIEARIEAKPRLEFCHRIKHA